MRNCYPEKTNVDQGEAEVNIAFRGVTLFSMLPSRAVNNYYIILNVN